MEKYSNTQVAYHWLTAVLILFMVVTGLAFTYEIAGAGRETIMAHQVAGQMLVALLALRITTRLIRRTVPADDVHPAWQRLLAQGVHVGLYLVMLGFVVTGYVSASAMSTNALMAPVDIGFARSDTGEVFLLTHFALKWVLLGLLSLHIAGALKHLIIDRDSTFSRMTFSSSR